MAKRRKRKIRLSLKIIIFLIAIFLCVLSFFYVKNFLTNISINNNINKLIAKIEHNNEEKAQKYMSYNKCLLEEYNDNDLTEELQSKINETNEFLNKYNTSVGYEDSNTKFTYKYNENKVYYAASTIKMLDALYLYEKASKGEVNLDETITYQSKYLRGASIKMGKKSYGDKVKIRDLVSYAVIYSDNIAHAMLLDYIGKSTLREYGRGLGAKYTLDSDDFGEITVNDALIYLEALNKYLETGTSDAKELKSYFINSEQNYLNFPDDNIEAVQKYGEYDVYYHENGIVYTNKPYFVSILTLHGNNEKIVRTINSKILELHNTFNEQRLNRCKKLLEN